jgi:hypothetical protein
LVVETIWRTLTNITHGSWQRARASAARNRYNGARRFAEEIAFRRPMT